MKRLKESELEDRAAEFNGRIPHGTPVIFYRLKNPLRDPVAATTRGEAFVMGSHSVMVRLYGMSGCFSIDHIVRREEAVKP